MNGPCWQPICRIDDIPVRGARRVSRPGGADVAIFRTGDDRLFALLDRCPHRGGPLSQGLVFGDRVACPLHNWTVGLSDGRAQAPDDGCTQRFACRLEGGRVLLDAHELATLALDPPGPGQCAAQPPWMAGQARDDTARCHPGESRDPGRSPHPPYRQGC